VFLFIAFKGVIATISMEEIVDDIESESKRPRVDVGVEVPVVVDSDAVALVERDAGSNVIKEGDYVILYANPDSMAPIKGLQKLVL
jgi:hypothetical protein